MSEHANLIRVSTMRPAKGRRQDLIALAEQIADRGRALPGCFGIQVCSVREEPESVAVVSRWKDAQAVADLEAMLAEVTDRERDLLHEAPTTYHLTPL